MAQSRLIELSYFDPHTSIRLTTYADTIVTDYSSPNRIISAVRFGGYPEVVKAIRLYGMQQQLAASTQGPNEAAVTDKLLEELEQSSRQAHEAVGFTYIPLEQQAALQ